MMIYGDIWKVNDGYVEHTYYTDMICICWCLAHSVWSRSNLFLTRNATLMEGIPPFTVDSQRKSREYIYRIPPFYALEIIISDGQCSCSFTKSIASCNTFFGHLRSPSIQYLHAIPKCSYYRNHIANTKYTLNTSHIIRYIYIIKI